MSIRSESDCGVGWCALYVHMTLIAPAPHLLHYGTLCVSLKRTRAYFKVSGNSLFFSLICAYFLKVYLLLVLAKNLTIFRMLSSSFAARRKAELHLRRSEHGTRVGSRAVFTFAQPTEKKKIPYREQQARLRRSLARCPKLQDGSILDTLEKGGERAEQSVCSAASPFLFAPPSKPDANKDFLLFLSFPTPAVAYPVIHVKWDLPPSEETPDRHLRSPLFPTVAASTPNPADDDGAFHFSVAGKKSCSSDALLSMSETAEDKATTSVGIGKQERRPTGKMRLLREDALGSSVHVQQGTDGKLAKKSHTTALRHPGDHLSTLFLPFSAAQTLQS